MTTVSPLISVVIPVERESPYLFEALEQYSKQSFKRFEVIIASSLPIRQPFPFVRIIVNTRLRRDVSSKRNVIKEYGKGEIFVFNDDDVYVPHDYLRNVVRVFQKKSVIAAAGPLLTPSGDSIMQRAGGAVWESYLGSDGIYKSLKKPRRTVYDYPAANLIVRAEIFKKVGGFIPGVFPGEDTKLCLDILNTYGKGVQYDPLLFAYHHRKALFRDHLKQIGRYANQRGWFAITYPETSFRLQYFLPAALLFYILTVPVFLLTDTVSPFFVLLPLLIYAIVAAGEGILISVRRGPVIAGIAVLGIVATHLYYGYCFSKSFIRKIGDRMWSFVRLINRL